ncbi:MAG: hypothetical protein ACLPTB_00045 [Acidimicrobiales bacterium]
MKRFRSIHRVTRLAATSKIVAGRKRRFPLCTSACVAIGLAVVFATTSTAVGAATVLIPRTRGVASAVTTWRRGVEIRLPMNAKPANQSAGLYSVACPRAGDCVAGGAYESTQGGDAMVVTESSGRWRQATEVTLPSNAQSQPYAEVNGVACAAVGSCVAVGYYSYEFPDVDNAFLVTETHGTWGSATDVQLPANSASVVQAGLQWVACARPGFCVATGGYLDQSGNFQAMVVTEAKGKWGRATELQLPANAGAAPDTYMSYVTCTGARSCVAVGEYQDRSIHSQGMVAVESKGRWQRAVEVRLPSNAAADPDAGAYSVSCWKVGGCLVLGSYTDKSHVDEAMALIGSGGRWARATEVRFRPPHAAANSADDVGGLWCAPSASCVAVGDYKDTAGHLQDMAATWSEGKWSHVTEIPQPRNENSAPDSYLYAVACARAGSCNAVGYYKDNSGIFQAMAATTG